MIRVCQQTDFMNKCQEIMHINFNVNFIVHLTYDSSSFDSPTIEFQ